VIPDPRRLARTTANSRASSSTVRPRLPTPIGFVTQHPRDTAQGAKVELSTDIYTHARSTKPTQKAVRVRLAP
jgi:hypothetical protein